MTSGELLKEVNEYCEIPGGVSTVTINRAVRKYMYKGEWPRKRMTSRAVKKFTENNNNNYSKDYSIGLLNKIHEVALPLLKTTE